MKNSLMDLNNHLFAQIERLSDEDLEGEKLKEEIERSKSVKEISQQIINNGALVLAAARLADNSNSAYTIVPKMLTGDKDGS